MLRIVKSQDIQILASDLAHVVNQQSDVFASVPMIVPSMALGDWLDKYLAEVNGIAVLTQCHFWGNWQWELVEKIAESKYFRSYAPLSLSEVRWRLFAWLYKHGQQILSDDQHPLYELLSVLFGGQKSYDEGAVSRLWTLSEQFARIFVRYMTLRSDWLTVWQQGRALPITEMLANQTAMPEWLKMHYHQLHHSQRFLWQTLFADIYQQREQRIDKFWYLLATYPEKKALLPKQIVVFTMQGMTPDILSFLEKLSRHTNIILYHQTPTEQWFDDIVDGKWLQRYQIDHPKAADAHYDAGHTLVSRFGKQARDQSRLLTRLLTNAEEGSLAVVVDELAPTSSVNKRLLGILQQEIHEFGENVSSRAYFKQLMATDTFEQDDSFRVYACHGLMRQLEVLRIQIIQWLNQDASRQLSDILVVLPEIGDKQALIQAVFPPNGRYDGLVLPARITGVTAPDTLNLWAALSGYFTLLENGFHGREVIDWLLLESNIQALGISAEDMQRAVELLEEAGFRRGFDEAHLQAGFAAGDDDFRFSFCYALDRLLVGLLMPEVSYYHESAPLAHVTMADSVGINALAQVAETFRKIRLLQSKPHHIGDWLQCLAEVLNQEFSAALQTQAYKIIEQSIRELNYQLAGKTALSKDAKDYPIPLNFILHYIESGLADRQVSSEPSGVITIGRLSALRGLPYKLIAFINANIDDFPAGASDDRYDLTTIDRRRSGDQIKEDDDLSAFLDVLLSAREACWFFYDRYKPEDSHEYLPSIVLQELLDYLSAYCPDPDNALARFIIEYPQNPFDGREDYQAIAPLWQGIRKKLSLPNRIASKPLLDITLPHAVEVFAADVLPGDHDVLAVDYIVADLIYPACAFAHAHDMTFLADVAEFDILEPLTANHLTRHQLFRYLIEQAYLGAKTDNLSVLKRLPLAPAGAYGRLWLERQQQIFNEQLTHLLKQTQSTRLTQVYSQQIDTLLGIISAELPQPACQHAWLMMSAGKMKDKHLLRAWLYHLLWQIQREKTEDIHQDDIIPAMDRGYTYVQFMDELAIFTALPAATAQTYFNDWLSVWQYLHQHLWLAPIELLFKYHELKQDPKNDSTEKLDHQLKCLCRNWLASNYVYKIDSEDIWTHLLQGYAPEEIEQYLVKFVAAYTERLIVPIYRHQDHGADHD
ncbi:MAG: hypothetical protein CSA10_01050 [Cardiobacteriales bacterium]|nr:MAG: hypothetical protein CSA10_01050 [Cardiobacteriales bacterium]